MKYDRDMIQAMYILQQNDEQLAERIWKRFFEEEKKEKVSGFQVNSHFNVPEDVILFVRVNSKPGDKVDAIRNMRMKTGWGLKESKEAVDLMISKGILH